MLQCKPLIDKITARITTCMAKCLSYVGRLQLVKTLLFGVQAYWDQLFLLPNKVIKMIEVVCRSYLWTVEATIIKKTLVDWDTICLPRRIDELDFLNLKIKNQAAICKLLWIIWIHTYYIKKQGIDTIKSLHRRHEWLEKFLNMRKY